MIKLYTDDVSEYVQDNSEYIKECLQENDTEINNKNIDSFALEMIENDTTELKQAATHHDGTNLFKFYYIKGGKRYAINYNIFINCY